ncbi:chaplin family protein [Streptomyces sp. NBC_01275]|uniref:chaplin n=1 Tax=Streptomyces sp. NBC_01275 TaxID=2903807 RepID=UPI0022523170|nr:chaplin family protein [Streptomyces sp. NBC_01275]MCX4767473.1 chaplin family protein [Streptomyces sp. NBC_01275]
MKRVTRNSVIAVAAASGAMAVVLPAHADSAAVGAEARSPGLISGNGVQLPVNLPVNLCGNTVNVVGVLNPAAGTACANKGAGAGAGTAAGAGTGAAAEGGATDSPGVVSGNGVQLPVHLPVNASGNSVNVVGILNPAIGNESVNTSEKEPAHPAHPAHPVAPAHPAESAPQPQSPTRHTPPAKTETHPGPKTVPAAPEPEGAAPETVPSLARTGADGTLSALAGSTAMVLGGAALYRRFRPRTER